MVYIPGRIRKKEGAKETTGGSDIDFGKLDELKKTCKELEQANLKIREAHIEMIMRLAVAAEYRDPDTGAHIIRMSDYATELAKALKLSDDEVEIIRYASPMHDIGKIAIPDKILLKEDKLTPEEFEVMKTHTVIGARFFQNAKSPLLQAAHDIALSHHENFDGTGYPQGLKGEAIPLYARIVSTADIFDAMVSKRCYKKAYSFEESLEYVKSLAWKQLDPQLVYLFVQSEKNIRKIYQANKTIESFVGGS